MCLAYRLQSIYSEYNIFVMHLLFNIMEEDTFPKLY